MSAAYENLQVYKSAKDLVVYLEIIIRGFPRYHKYTMGTDLRKLAYAALMSIIKANIKIHREAKLREALDQLLEIKARIEVCADCNIFNNKNNYPTAIKKIIDVTEQCGGWLRSCKGSLQNKLTS